MHHLTISVSSDQVRQVLARLGRCRSSVCKPCDRHRLSFLLTRPHSQEWARFLPSEYSAQLWVTETLRSIYMYRTCYVTLRTSGTKKWLRLLRIDFQAWAWLTKSLIDLVKEMNQILPSLKCLKALFWNCTRCIIATQELNVRAQVFVPLRVSHRVYSDSYTYLLTRIIRILLHSSISKFAQRIERQSEVDAVNERDQHGSSHLGRLISNAGPNRCIAVVISYMCSWLSVYSIWYLQSVCPSVAGIDRTAAPEPTQVCTLYIMRSSFEYLVVANAWSAAAQFSL